MPAGYRVYTEVNRPDRALVKRFEEHGSADLSDVLHKSGTMDAEIAQVYRPMTKVVGTAVTVSIPTGALSVWKEAIQQSQAGDVLVVNAYGNPTTAVLGANICRGMLHRGLAGMIVDGAIRDVSELRGDGFPVLARSIATAAGPSTGPGEVNVPIACGRAVVHPGDIVVADEDGTVVIRPADAEDILQRVVKLKATLAALQDVLLQGGVTNIANIEKQLREDGCEFVDGVAPA